MNKTPDSDTDQNQLDAFPKLSRDKSTLRNYYRQKRRAIPQREKQRAAQRLCQQFKRSGLQLNCQRLALYLANDGEIDPERLARYLWKCGKQVYLPVLHPAYPGRLIFRRYLPGCRFRKNRYGIAEPVNNAYRNLNPKFLSVALLPLVAFDQQGNRLGMGGGYYDRSFSFKRHYPGRTPRLIGVAYDIQNCGTLPTESWDVPLDAILTDGMYYQI